MEAVRCELAFRRAARVYFFHGLARPFRRSCRPPKAALGLVGRRFSGTPVPGSHLLPVRGWSNRLSHEIPIASRNSVLRGFWRVKTDGLILV